MAINCNTYNAFYHNTQSLAPIRPKLATFFPIEIIWCPPTKFFRAV